MVKAQTSDNSRILIVDDDEFNVDVLVQSLGDQGFHTDTAHGGKEALDKVANAPPDLILLDVMMPDIDGITVCGILKDDPDTRFIPIVIMTALNSTDDRVRGIEAGADDFLSKPVDERELLARINTLLHTKKNVDLAFEELRSAEVERDQLEISVRRMQSELNIAKDIQTSMLPLTFPAFPDRKEFEIFAESVPAREVGGDFFDFFLIDQDHLCFVVGDVSGKGVPAALFMAVTKTLIKSRAADDISTASILTNVNNELSESNKTSMFATVFICILNVQTGELVHTNAGHNPPYILRENRYLIRLNPLHGPVIGPMSEMSYQERKISLDINDTLLLYTDGVPEAMNPNEDLFTEKQLVEVINSNMDLSAEALTNEIIAAVKGFEDGADQADDITVMALKYYGAIDVKDTGYIRLKIKNQMRELIIVEEQFDNFCKRYKIPDEARQKISVVLDELLNNIVTYAFPEDEEEHIIELKFVINDNRLIITIYDDGVPFNPFELDPPDIILSLDERSIGGLGTFLVRNLMDDEDEYLYTRQNGMNVVRLVKVTDKE